MILASCKHHPTEKSPHTQSNMPQNELQPLPLQLELIANHSETRDSWVNRLSLFSYCNNSENLEFNFVPFSLSLIIKLQQFIDFHTFIQTPMLVQALYFTGQMHWVILSKKNHTLSMKTLNINLYKYWHLYNEYV